LLLRCVTRRGLLRAVLHFLFVYEYDGVRVVDVLLRRLEGNSQLSLVSLALMETLIDLNCEDVMVDLVFKHLLNGHHLMVAYRHKIADPEPYRDAAIAFLGLSPRCCSRPMEMTKRWIDELAMSGRRVLDLKSDNERRVNGVHDDIAMSSLVHEIKVNYGNPNDTLFGNYHAYICDSRFEIVSRVLACSNWTSRYDSVTPPKRETNNNTKETKEIDIVSPKEQDSLISCTSGYETKTSDSSEKEQHSLTSLNEQENEVKTELNELKEHDSLTSTGESSGYESFKYKEGEGDEGFAEELFRRSFVRKEDNGYEGEVPLIRSWRASAESIIGPLLASLLKKTAVLLESEVIVNCRVTSVVSKLASLPTPLLTSLLLCPGFVLQPNVPSLFQILSKLKEEV
ncbi:UPF0518 protein v1g243165-like, partial [Spodoptera litura]|uniref:UPF0518 protein v1g243165-like n=1 Tax=Spodoptera litura TaxID=69820 RepID=A0A9J7EW27_SPOLT